MLDIMMDIISFWLRVYPGALHKILNIKFRHYMNHQLTLSIPTYL